MKKPKFVDTIYTWTTAKASRTWYAHGIAALAITLIVGELYAFFGGDLAKGQVGTSSFVLIYYIFREMGDEMKHRQMGEWLKTATLDQVTYAADQKGDLIGPIFVCATCWLILL